MGAGVSLGSLVARPRAFRSHAVTVTPLASRSSTSSLPDREVTTQEFAGDLADPPYRLSLSA